VAFGCTGRPPRGAPGARAHAAPASHPFPPPRRGRHQACPDARAWAGNERRLLLNTLVHLADLANPARPFPIAAAWAERVITEFMMQGDREAAAGLPVTGFCDRELVAMPGAQLSFIGTFMQVRGPGAGEGASANAAPRRNAGRAAAAVAGVNDSCVAGVARR
jgi:hypothetical protein